jgi:polyisoprenyl-phosphate glycosyltransferase
MQKRTSVPRSIPPSAAFGLALAAPAAQASRLSLNRPGKRIAVITIAKTSEGPLPTAADAGRGNSTYVGLLSSQQVAEPPQLLAPVPGPAALLSSSGANRPYISVVIPVYKAERILPALCERLRAALQQLTSDYEVILVCDGSPDRSWPVMQQLVPTFPQLVAVNLSRNFGQHCATTAGFDLARGQWIVVMDCDLQDPPEAIGSLLAKAQEGYDIVSARRKDRQHSWLKRQTSHLYYVVFGLLSGAKLDPTIGSFRLMSRTVVDALCSMRETYRMLAGMIDWLGFRTSAVDVEHAARHEGHSSYTLSRLLRLAFDGMISFSNRPLYISIGAGLTLSVLSAGYGAFLLLRYALDPGSNTVAGWLSTVLLTTFIGGLILLNQGVLGIYLGRLYNQAKGRPLYVIEKVSLGLQAQGRWQGKTSAPAQPGGGEGG